MHTRHGSDSPMLVAAAFGSVVARFDSDAACRVTIAGRDLPVPTTGTLTARAASLGPASGTITAALGGRPFPAALVVDDGWRVVSDSAVLSGTLTHEIEHLLSSANVEVATVGLSPRSLAAISELAGPVGAFLGPENVIEAFTAIVAAHPARLAVESHTGEGWSYVELDRRRRAIAGWLLDAGVQPGERVALLSERSADLIAAILGILTVGAAYAPLDPAYPAERLAMMLADAGANVGIASAAYASTLGTRTTLVLGAEPEGAPSLHCPASRHDAAYVMYTSGSTGVPKGVVVPHRAILRLVLPPDGARFAEFRAGDRVLVFAPTAFDASTLEIFGPLLTGGTLVVYPAGHDALDRLAAFIVDRRIDIAWLTAAIFHAMVDAHPEALAGLRQLLAGGDVLDPDRVARVVSRLGPEARLVNGYGPTENTTFTACHVMRPGDVVTAPVPIGRPIAGTSVWLLDDAGAPVPRGAIGDLWAGGHGVALGYLGQPERTAERFAPDPNGAWPGALRYATGDRARWRDDGALEFLGRRDGQVKIRGFRVELGEVETALRRIPGLVDAVVAPRTLGDEVGLVAWVVAGPNAPTPTLHGLRGELERTLPPAFVPSRLVVLAVLPVNANGKVDRAALPEPGRARPALAEPVVAPRTALERAVVDVYERVLGIDGIGVHDSFFELGGSSLQAARATPELRQALGRPLSIVELFERRTPAALIARSGSSISTAASAQSVDRVVGARSPVHEIAIIGVAGRFPGADTVQSLWQALLDRRELVTFFGPGELDPDVPAAEQGDPAYVAARGIVEGADLFDAAFFGMSPRQAEVTDPQHRLFLETASDALESAGYVPATAPGAIGVFGGSDYNTYRARYVDARPDLLEAMGSLQIRYGNDKDYVPITVAHRLDLRGPAVSIHTACSTSLVAVAQAALALRAGQCALALAGGVNVVCPQRSGHTYVEGAMFSSDGHTRTFDAGATGTVFSDGCAVLVLRPLADAEAAGDTIYGVIAGLGVANDGADRASFSAPSAAGQARAVAMAIADAGIASEAIEFVEAHGTATPIGDPIEVAGLTQAFSTERRGYCAIGSIKSNVGHLTAAAGATGLIKAALALHHRVLPATLHVVVENPALGLPDTPFYVAKEPVALAADRPVFGGVSAMGVGGTNAHVIVRSWHATHASCLSDRSTQAVWLSARSEAALDRATERLADWLDRSPDLNLADVAFTLAVGRRAFDHRRVVLVDGSPSTAAIQLRARAADRGRQAKAPTAPPEVVFLFPGQGAQYVDMGRALYRTEPVFRQSVDASFDTLARRVGLDLRPILFPDGMDTSDVLRDTAYAQPALLVLALALADLLGAVGIEPAVLVGHSVGEFAAAVLAGVMSREDALALVALRGRLMSRLPAGRMLAVRLPADTVAAAMPEALSLACSNAPELSVVAGPSDDVEAFAVSLEARGVRTTKLVTSHAFHSSMMDPILPEFRDAVGHIALSAPRLPIISTATGLPLTDAEATSPDYWTRHVRATVRFNEAARVALSTPGRVAVEVGPRATAATFARQVAVAIAKAGGPRAAVTSLLEPSEPGGEHATFLRAVGELWTLGVPVDAAALYAAERRRRVPLPTYPFERKRFFADRRPSSPAPVTTPAVPALVSGPSAPPVTTVTLPPPPAAPIEQERPSMPSRTDRLTAELFSLVADLSGEAESDLDATRTFADHGFDSLLLTQLAQDVARRWKVKLSFKDLATVTPSIVLLAAQLDRLLPPEAAPAPSVSAPTSPAPAVASVTGLPPADGAGLSGAPAGVEALLHRQLDLISQQMAWLRTLGTAPGAVAPTPAPAAPAREFAPPPAASGPALPPAALEAIATASHAVPRNPNDPRPTKVRALSDLPDDARAAVTDLVARYSARTARSKAHVQAHRRHHADPRTASGFNPVWKEMVYPIVVERSSGARLWDLDGNEYIDILNGFGPNFLGHNHPDVTAAIAAQLARGYEVGPQTPLAGEAAALVCKLTGMARASFTCTGSEAVQAAIRCARTFTGREKVVVFTKDYHGNFDEVLVRAANSPSALKTLPSAPGIPRRAVADIIVLEYGHDASLELIRVLAPELAAVIVEPVQSRRPELQPKAFLETLRAITKESGTVLVFDEVVTGFRCHPGGAQAVFGVEADLATYGKVVAGGLPIGIVAGRSPIIDTFDGGDWQFGDDSKPEAGVTFFAGTFVRHPLAMAAVHATLTVLDKAGPTMQAAASAHTADLTRRVGALFERFEAPYAIPHFGSQFYIRNNDASELGALLWAHLRLRGVHALETFPSYLTIAHGPAEVDVIVDAFEDSLNAMADGGLLPPSSKRRKTAKDVVRPAVSSTPPAPGARLGKDPTGRPAWFAPDPTRPGKWVEVKA